MRSRAATSQPGFQSSLPVKRGTASCSYTFVELLLLTATLSKMSELRSLASCWERETKVKKNGAKGIIWRMGKLLNQLTFFSCFSS